jgi:hypothetical protein
MEAQRSKNFNEFYRSTGEHLVNIRTPRMFWEGALPCKFANFKMQNEECHYYAIGWSYLLVGFCANITPTTNNDAFVCTWNSNYQVD